MMNTVYLRMTVYVLSFLLGLLPAGMAGLVFFDAERKLLSIDVEGVVAAVVSAAIISGGVFAKWGVKT